MPGEKSSARHKAAGGRNRIDYFVIKDRKTEDVRPFSVKTRPGRVGVRGGFYKARARGGAEKFMKGAKKGAKKNSLKAPKKGVNKM